MSEAHPPPSKAGTIVSRRAYTGRIISLDVDTVRYPDGSTGDLEMIRHPGASAIVPFASDPRGGDPTVLLLRQYRYAAGGTLFEIPAGRLEPGEAPSACAVRELREETGCTAERITPLFSMYTTPGFTDELIHVFVATGLTRGAAVTERDEFIEVVELPLSECMRMVERGEVRDAKTALSLLFASRFHT